MAPYKRGKWWWTDFTVNGVRYRERWAGAQPRERNSLRQACQPATASGPPNFLVEMN